MLKSSRLWIHLNKRLCHAGPSGSSTKPGSVNPATFLPSRSVSTSRSSKIESQPAPTEKPDASLSTQLPRIDSTNPFLEIPETWVTNFDEIEEKKLDLMQLHPDVFRTFPRIDILSENIRWQTTYRNISYVKALTKAEMPGGGRKPWKQTGIGKSRAGSIRAPQWKYGGVANGIRGPRTWFYVLPDSHRIKGLCVALSIKHAQDDLVIVDSFQNLPENISVPSGDSDSEEKEILETPQILQYMAEQRNWGYSVLFVDTDDQCPINLATGCHGLDSFTAMPYYGLNCYSILKHSTLVMTKAAVEKVQDRLLKQLYRADPLHKQFRYMDYKKRILEEGEQDEDESIMPPFV